MKYATNNFKVNLFFLLLLIGFAIGGWGFPAADEPIAEVMFSASDIKWMPLVSYYQLDLTISRPEGTLYQKIFDRSSTPYASIEDIYGKSFLDGSYIYELRVIPELNKKRESDEVEIRYSMQMLVQTGGFSVLRGEIVNPEESEPEKEKLVSNPQELSVDGISRSQDFLIGDDLVVDGSACIGFDCVSGESFGFDTLRFKENNLRIKFDDTSTLSSYPRNDWQITANDSVNGGASKFSVEDISGSRVPFTIEANARSNSLYVDDGGRIGIRTSTPALEIHVIDGDTPALRLQQDGSSGFAPQTWDVAGNESNFFIRDVTNGSALPLRIRPGAPSNSICIASGGNVGLGTASPAASLHVEANSDPIAIYANTNNTTNAEIQAERDGGALTYMSGGASRGFFGTKNNFPLRLAVNDSYVMEINSSGSYINMVDGGSYNGTWNNGSSREIKENIRDLTLDEAVETLNGLNPVKYNYKAFKDDERLGFIAEDVPEKVAMKDRKSLSSMDIVAVLTKVLQKQQKINAQLKEEIAQLKKKLHDK